MKEISLMIMLCLFVASVNGQDLNVEESSGSHPISYGVKGGGQFIGYIQTNTPKYTAEDQWGYHGGVFGEYNFGLISAGVEALFVMRPLQTTVVGSSYQDQVRTEAYVHYLDVPIYAKYSVMPNVSVLAGANGSFYLFDRAYRQTDINGFRLPEIEGPRTLEERNEFERFEKYVIGAFAGAEYKFDFGLIAGARYLFQITNYNVPTRGGYDLQSGEAFLYAKYDLSKLF